MTQLELTKKEMEAVLLAHEIAELETDIEATMATLGPNPHYELVTLGLAVDGEAAVREAYSRILPGNRKRNVAAEMRIHAIAANTLVREAHMSYTTSDGERVTGGYMVVMSFDPAAKLISGERMYMDPAVAAMFREDLGTDFESLPGVSKFSDNAPMIDRHDAYAVAERRGLTIR
jgi:hypothetical protein